MSEDKLTPEEKQTLLQVARQALEGSVRGEDLPSLDLQSMSPRLQEQGATFVTLTIDGNLRGCIGALDAHQPLVEDVREHAIAAALQDFRFPNVEPGELPLIEIEVSRLTHPIPLVYDTPENLLATLRPEVDGVLICDGSRRATFLPQVWEKLPDPIEFLNSLCYKMGVAPDLWRKKHLGVSIYQVEEFREY